MTSNLIGALVTRRRLVLAVATLMALSGLVAWATMPRQEDPRFANRFAIVIAPYPGADPEKIERLVVERIEEQLSDVEAIKRVISQAQTGVALINIELSSSVAASETTAAWDEVRRALERARRELPRGVGTPVLDDKISNNVSVLLAVSGEKTPRDLMKDVRSLERRLLGFRGVARVILVGEPKEQVIVEYDDSTARRYGISAHKLGRALRSRNANLPGGSVVLGARRATLDPDTSFNSLDEIRRLPVALPKGNATVALSQLASVRFGVASPARPRMRHDGRPAVGLGIVATQGIDQVAFGKALREQIAKLRSQYKGLAISEVTFQPQRVETRLTNLRGSLLLGVAVLGSILILAMGIRLGLLVSLIVPLVALSSLAVYAMGGGVLHQISIAGLVIALGMLVDNAIVVAEDIQRRLDEGISRSQAAVATIRELSFPLATATATTLAAFVPMLMSKGNTADFTRALPIVVMLSLVVSYVFALAVTPALGAALLRPNRNVAKADSPKGWLFRVSSQLSAVATARPKLTLLIVMLLVVGSLALAPMVPRQFFPSSDRDQLLVSVELPVGTKLERTATLSRRLERALLARNDVRSVTAFIGRSAPRFYYNIRQDPQSPHRASLLVQTRSVAAVDAVSLFVTRFSRQKMTAALVVPKRLEQGPPISAPVELRLFGDSLVDLQLASAKVQAALSNVPNTIGVRSDLGLGTASMKVVIDDAAAARRGVTREQVAQVLFGQTHGLAAGQYRVGDEPIPIVVRSRRHVDASDAQLFGATVTGRRGEAIPIAQIARPELIWRPAMIVHRHRQRVVTVRAELAAGMTFDRVLKQLKVDQLQLPKGVDLRLGGALEGSSEANEAVLSAAPLGALLLLFFLLLEFNSFRRLLIVLATVPLAAVGVIPGLVIAQQPFGFMSMLGAIALVGIVVNNAIVLLDLVERLREQGVEGRRALTIAVQQRVRPIALTAGTTVAGLLPLALGGTTLWPPMAWAMISGLVASTSLCLLLVPALYRLLFLRQSKRGRAPRKHPQTASEVPA